MKRFPQPFKNITPRDNRRSSDATVATLPRWKQSQMLKRESQERLRHEEHQMMLKEAAVDPNGAWTTTESGHPVFIPSWMSQQQSSAPLLRSLEAANLWNRWQNHCYHAPHLPRLPEGTNMMMRAAKMELEKTTGHVDWANLISFLHLAPMFPKPLPAWEPRAEKRRRGARLLAANLTREHLP